MLWILLMLPLLPRQDSIDEQVEEFRRFYSKNRSRAEKIEAIHVLEGCDRRTAAELLMEALKDPEFPVRQAAVAVLQTYRTGPVKELLIEAAADRKLTRGGVRAAVIEALGGMGASEATDVLLENLEDRDVSIRCASGVALGNLRITRAVEPLKELLAESEPALRTVALEALGKLNRPKECMDAVQLALQDSEWQVRSAAIGALRAFSTKECIGPLILVLASEEGRLREDAGAALQEITTFTYPPEAESWQRWWDGIKDRFEVPTEEERRRKAEAEARALEKYQTTQGFAGIPTKSKRILFVIDVSGSMEELVADAEQFRKQGRQFRSMEKMEIVKEELIRTIEGMESGTRFNILTFATDVEWWKKSLVVNNVVNVNGAVKFIEGLRPIGGGSQTFRGRAGLNTDVEKGKTNTYDALMAALDASAGNDYDRSYGRSPVDTIYFLSDGTPTVGKYTEDDEIIAEVQRVNELRKVVIHTIAIGNFRRNFMETLARQNGGKYVDLGK